MKLHASDIVFNNFDEALAFVLSEEKKALEDDATRRNDAIFMFPAYTSNTTIKIYPEVAYRNNGNERDFKEGRVSDMPTNGYLSSRYKDCLS